MGSFSRLLHETRDEIITTTMTMRALVVPLAAFAAAVALPAIVRAQDLLPLFTECEQDADCASGRCFQGWRCQCNSETNAGCEEGETCSDVLLVADNGSPTCVSPEEWTGAIGSECLVDTDCDNGAQCWNGFQPLGTPGSCQCSLSKNAGCEEMETCWEDAYIADGPPQCIDFSVLLPTGSECSFYSECASWYCSNDGVCSCNTQFGTSCEDSLLPLGSECLQDAECATDHCFEERCLCNPKTNAGCDDGLICSDDPIAYDGPPTCLFAQGRGPIGSECQNDNECASDRCFRDGFSDEPGLCFCNSETNAGCDDGSICSDDPIAYDGAPTCLFAESRGPIGSECVLHSECASGVCWYSDQIPGSPGSCQCNPSTNDGCDEESQVCLDDPTIDDEPPRCVALSDMLPLGSGCNYPLECSTLTCFYYMDESIDQLFGVCSCNTETNAGCDEETEACLPVPGSPTSPPVCTERTSLNLLIGSECQDNNECASNRCFQGFFRSPHGPGLCRCNSDTNAGCGENESCFDPNIPDEPPHCVAVSDLFPIGSECVYDDDCASLRCFRGEQLPDTPGMCACNSRSNAGCNDGLTCSDEPTYADGFPECVGLGVGNIGDECEDDLDCASNRCFYSRGTPGSCRCNSETNAGCDTDQICDDSPTFVDLFPVCVKAGIGDIVDDCENDLDCGDVQTKRSILKGHLGSFLWWLGGFLLTP